jgi:hypothetical protein
VSGPSIRAPRGWLGAGRLVDDVRVICGSGVVVQAGPAGDGTATTICGSTGS